MKVRYSLRYRIAGTILILEAAMMALVLWQTLSLSVQGAKNQQSAYEQTTLDAATEISRNALISEEYDDLLPYITTVLNSSGITHALVTDHTNKVIASTHLPELGQPLPNLTNTDHDYWRRREIANQNEKLGTLAIKFSNAKLTQATQEALNLGITIALTGMGFIAVVGLLMGYLLTRKLEILRQAAQRFAKGDWSVKTKLTGRDEVGELAMAFDHMADNLQQQMNELESRVRERTQELGIARDEAVKANRIKSRFLANMSHELRTPLNAVIGYSEILAEQNNNFSAEIHADLNKIRNAGLYLLRMINEILDLSKIESGKMEVHPEPFDIGSLVQDVVESIQPLMEKNNNQFTVSIDQSLGVVTSDINKVHQTLTNLLGNAAKFTHNGHVSLHVVRENDQTQEFIVFKVQDNGIGISKPQLDKLFVEFSQADESISIKYGGTGLGLVIAKSFCEMLGGDISVTSELGKGSLFTAKILVNSVSLQKKHDHHHQAA